MFNNEANSNLENEINSECIHRCPHDKENPFTSITNKLLQNSDLSFEALGLLCYLLSNSFKWKTCRSAIGRQRKIGEHKLKRIFDELIEHGYLTMTFINGKNGNRQVKYLFSESNKFKKIVPHLDFPGPVFPGTTKEQVLLNTTTTNDNACDMLSSLPAVVASTENTSCGSSCNDSSKAKVEVFIPPQTKATKTIAPVASSSQPVDKSKAQGLVDKLLEKVDEKFDPYMQSEIKKAIEVALQEHSGEVVAASIEDLNLKEPSSIKSIKGLFSVICNANKLKGPRKVVDTTLLEKRTNIAKCLAKISSNCGGHTFDDKKLYVHSGSITKEFTFSGNDRFWSEMEEFVRSYVKTSPKMCFK